MKTSAEKWIPCTSNFPDYEIFVGGPMIAIRRVKPAQGSYKGKTISLQFYKGQFRANLYDRFGRRRPINVLDMAKWSAQAAWRRERPEKPKETVQVSSQKPALTPQPPPVPPKRTKERIHTEMLEIQQDCYRPDSVRKRQLDELKAELAALQLEASGGEKMVSPPVQEAP